jgi:hypothetical protein
MKKLLGLLVLLVGLATTSHGQLRVQKEKGFAPYFMVDENFDTKYPSELWPSIEVGVHNKNTKIGIYAATQQLQFNDIFAGAQGARRIFYAGPVELWGALAVGDTWNYVNKFSIQPGFQAMVHVDKGVAIGAQWQTVWNAEDIKFKEMWHLVQNQNSVGILVQITFWGDPNNKN